ncbi:beta-1,4-glucuronyltransferase 1-like [Cloeon dipterum]|uniref:beta-1,4-glucuronyltransferase 1-like n=1 Tax=Cloeon dipterum TaxID=197152 RepID=UPI00321FAC3C
MHASSAWSRTILGLIVIIAGLQVLHLIMLSRLEGHQQQEVEIVNNVQSYQAEFEERPVITVESEFSDLLRMLQRGGVLDTSGQYRVVPALAAANGHATALDLTLVTQCSVQHLSKVARLAERWQGPLSVAVFAEEQDLGRVLWGIARLRVCRPAIRQHVAFHLVSPLGAAVHRTPILPPGADAGCHPDDTDHRQDKNYARSRVPYPVNLARNVARRAVQTEFVFVVDVDMLPSAKLREMFLAFAAQAKLFDKSQRDDKTVYVVPAFEAKEGTEAPSTKKQLLQMAKEGFIRPFYFELCWKCQMHTDYEAWQKESTNQQHLAPFFEVLWKDPWEPFFISRNSAPLYDERFKQYGFNRISQVCELHVAGFKFSVLDNAFLVHDGFKTAATFHNTKETEQELNRVLFRQFKSELKDRYPESSRRCY